MGNTSQEPSSVHNNSQNSLNHPRFLNAEVKTSPEGEQRISLSVNLQSEKEYDKWEKKLTRNPGKDDPNILNPVKFQYRKTGICGSNGRAQIEYENYPLTLKEEIQNRNREKYFAENQLWYLLMILANAGDLYHNNGLKVGDIRPFNIFLDNSGQIKVATSFTWPNEDENYNKAMKYGQKTYLSPQQIDDLNIGRAVPACDFEIAESFSMGLTMLSACLLYDCQKLYSQENQFNMDKFSRLRNILIKDQEYSEKFKQTILKLIRVEPKERLTAQDLKKQLQPYESQISQLQPFQFQQQKNKSNILIKDSTIEDHSTQPLQSKKDLTFSFNPPKKHHQPLPKTEQTTSLIRSRSSNIIKSQSPILQISNEKLFANPSTVRQPGPAEFILRDRSNSKMYQVERQMKPIENHPYYTNLAKHPIVQKTIVVRDNRKDNNFIVNFTFDKNKKVKNIPVQSSQQSKVSFMKKAQSTKSLRVESMERSRNQTKWADNYQPATSEYFVTNSVMSRGDMRKQREEREEVKKSRSSSLKLIDEKIAFSRRMFPY